MQETHFKDTDSVNIKGLKKGCSLFVKKDIPHEVLELDTELQAVAVKVSLHKTIAVCNVYIPPHFNVAQSDLDNLVMIN